MTDDPLPGPDPKEPVAKRDLRPFRQAVAALADSPGLRYQDSGTAPMRRDVTVGIRVT